MSAPTDLEAMIAQLRKGGVFHAEFHEDGSVKVLTMGPDPDAGGGDEEDDGQPSRTSALRAAARAMQFGPPPTEKTQ